MIKQNIITEEDIEKIIETYPTPINIMPHTAWQDQIRTHLKKYFGFYKELKKKD